MHLRQSTRLRLLRTLKERILRWIGATDEAAIHKYCNEDEPQGAQKTPFRAGSVYFDLVTLRGRKCQPYAPLCPQKRPSARKNGSFFPAKAPCAFRRRKNRPAHRPPLRRAPFRREGRTARKITKTRKRKRRAKTGACKRGRPHGGPPAVSGDDAVKTFSELYTFPPKNTFI